MVNYMKKIGTPVAFVPYNESRIMRQLAETGCAYAAAVQAVAQPGVSDQRLASEYARLLLLHDAMAVREFCERNRSQMMKMNTKEAVHKKAFADVLETAPRIACARIGSLADIGSLVSMPRLPSKLVVDGVEYGTPDSFMLPDGRLLVAVFANDLNDGPMGSPFRWWHRLALEGGMATMAAGASHGAEYILAGVTVGEVPSVRAVKLVLDAEGIQRELSQFAQQLKSRSTRACLNSSCRQCAADSVLAVVEEM